MNKRTHGRTNLLSITYCIVTMVVIYTVFENKVYSSVKHSTTDILINTKLSSHFIFNWNIKSLSPVTHQYYVIM